MHPHKAKKSNPVFSWVGKIKAIRSVKQCPPIALLFHQVRAEFCAVPFMSAVRRGLIFDIGWPNRLQIQHVAESSYPGRLAQSRRTRLGCIRHHLVAVCDRTVQIKSYSTHDGSAARKIPQFEKPAGAIEC